MDKSLMLGRFLLRMSCPLTAIAMNGLERLPDGAATAKENASTPLVGTAISSEAVLAGATGRIAHTSSLRSVF